MKNTVAVILAAGVGSRLRDLVTAKPKCMVHVNGEPIVKRQIRALLSNHVSKVVVVTGHRADELQAYLAQTFPGAPIQLVHNADYATTNNMFSLHLSAPAVGENELLLLNGDVAVGLEIIGRILQAPGSAVGVDLNAYHEESMKVIRQADGDSLGGISKKFGPAESLGSSIDLYRFNQADARVLFDHIADVTGRQGRRKEWTEVAIDELMRSKAISMQAVDVGGLPWYEIDTPGDLAQAEMIFGRQELNFNRFKAAFVDMDGTLYLGQRVIPGAAAFVQELRRRVGHVYFLSNNSSRIHDDYVAKLAACGITAGADEIVLSTDALVRYLQKQGIRRAFVLGTPAMRRHLAKHGMTETEDDPEAVILGYDTSLTYERLATAAILLQNPAVAYLATHPDKVCPTERGAVPDAGALAELLRVTTGRLPDLVLGKPNPAVVDWLLREKGVGGNECVFVGDRHYTDYALARACGGHFVGVLSGDSSRGDFEGLTGLTIFPSVADVFGGSQQ